MASKEEVIETPNHQTWILKVSIHCEGCKKKVMRILKNISGVHFVDIDAKQNKVTVTGDVDAETLIRRLAKSGKHANMWPEKKPAHPNPNPNPSPNPKEKNKEKEAELAAEPAAAATTEKIPAVTNAEPAAKPAETPKKPEATVAEPAEKEVPKSSGKEVAEPDKEPADTTPETDTKQAATSAKAVSSEKKKEKKQGEEPSGSEGHSGNSVHHQPLPAYQVPAYQHPVYAVSHNTAHPMASNSYYYALMPSVPQSYAHSSSPYPGYNYDHPSAQPHPEYYPYYGSESYYESYTDPRASPSRLQGQGSIDMFNDENANSCNVM